MSAQLPRHKIWHHQRVLSEHAFDKLRLIDCGFSEFEEALRAAEIIEETALSVGEMKELLLLVDWRRPLHVVVVVDDIGQEERIVTIYEPDPNQWDRDYRVRRI